MIAEEEDAIKMCFSGKFGSPHLDRLERYEDYPFQVYYPQGEDRQDLEVMHFHVNGVGNVDTSALTAAAIIEKKLDYVFLVGVAGGVRDRISHYDILIPTEVYFYELGKVSSSGFASYNKNVLPNAKMRNWARALAMQSDWAGTPGEQGEQRILSPQVVFGALAAGDKVITASEHEVWKDVIRHAPKTVGTEMESYGCLKAAYESGVPSLTIRCISDLLDDKDVEHDLDKDRKEIAANLAAHFVVGMIGQISTPRKNEKRYVVIIPECDLEDAELITGTVEAIFGEKLKPVTFERGSLKVTLEGEEEALAALVILMGAGLLPEFGAGVEFHGASPDVLEKGIRVGRSIRSQLDGKNPDSSQIVRGALLAIEASGLTGELSLAGEFRDRLEKAARVSADEYWKAHEIKERVSKGGSSGGRPQSIIELMTEDVSYPGWETDSAARPRFYLRGVTWAFRACQTFDVSDFRFFSDQGVDIIRRETDWESQIPAAPQNKKSFSNGWYEPPAYNQMLRAMGRGKPVVLFKAIQMMAIIEAALKSARRNDISPSDVYRNMYIEPAVYNIDRFTPKFLSECREKDARFDYEILSFTGQVDPEVFDDLASGKTVTRRTAELTVEFLNRRSDLAFDIGPIRFTPGNKKLGKGRATENEVISSFEGRGIHEDSKSDLIG